MRRGMASNPFLFGIDFDEDDPKKRKKKAAEQVEEAPPPPPPPPPPPTVLESEALKWKAEAYAKGKNDGQAEGTRIGEEKGRAIGFAEGHGAGAEEMRQSLEQYIAETLELLRQQFEVGNAQIDVIRQDFERQAVELAVALIRRLMPETAARHGLVEIETRIAAALSELTDEPRVLVRVNPQHHADLAQRLEALKAGTGYDGRLALVSDASLDLSDVRLEWQAGGAERLERNLWSMVDAAMVRIIGGENHQADGIKPADDEEAVEP